METHNFRLRKTNANSAETGKELLADQLRLVFSHPSIMCNTSLFLQNFLLTQDWYLKRKSVKSIILLVKRILNKSVTPKEVILARKQVSAHRKDIKKVEELFDEMGSNHLANILDKVNQTKKTSPTEAVTV